MVSERFIKKSRKSRQCYWCGEMIEIGESAVREFSTDGDVGNFFYHPECKRAMEEVSTDQWELIIDNADDTIPEHFFLRGSVLPKDERERV